MANFPSSGSNLAPWLNSYLAGQQSSQQAMSFPQELLAKELANRQAKLVEQITGVKAKYAEPEEQEELKKAQQYNQYYGPNMQSEMGLRGAQAGHLGELIKSSQFERGNPLLKSSGTSNIGALLADPTLGPVIRAQLQKRAGQQQPGIVPQIEQGQAGIPKNGNMPGPVSPEQSPTGAEQYVNQFLGGAAPGKGSKSEITQFDRAPAQLKISSLGQARAFGFNDTEALKLLREGKDLGDLAQMKGYSTDGSDWPTPIFTATTATQTRQQRANVAQAAIQAIEPDITKDMAPYARKFGNNVSPLMVYESIKGGSDEKIGNAVGSAAVAYELNAARIASGGINPGIGALRESMGKSQLDLHTPGLTLTPKQFEIASHRIAELISKMNSAENKAAFGQRGQAKNAKKALHELSDEEFEALKSGNR